MANKKENINWDKKEKVPLFKDALLPILNNFVLILEEEKKRTIKKIEEAKKLLEKSKTIRK